MLTLKNLSLTAADAQGRADIVKNVSLDVEDGKFLVITGPNGGGKTTLAKLIMGLAAPTGGQILLDGEDITGLSITDRAKRGISYSFQQPPRFKGMKVSDLLTIAAGKPLSHDEACSYLTQVGLCASGRKKAQPQARGAHCGSGGGGDRSAVRRSGDLALCVCFY